MVGRRQSRVSRRRRRRAAWIRRLSWPAIGLMVLFTLVELTRTSPALLARPDKPVSVKPAAVVASVKPAPKPAELTVHVVDASGGQAVPLAVIGIDDRYLIADESGTVGASDLRAGVVEVAARAPGYELYSARLTLSTGSNEETVTLGATSRTAGVTATPAFLTIDDGPDPRLTPRVLEILDDAQVKATFFLIGSRARAHPELARRIYLEGHEIGNHTYSHDYDALYGGSATDYVRSLDKAGAAFKQIVGFEPELTRPPGGDSGNSRAGWRGAIQRSGYQTRLCNVSWGDGTKTTGERMLAKVGTDLDRLGPREEAVILTHDVRPSIIEALPDMIVQIRKLGYEFVVTSARR